MDTYIIDQQQEKPLEPGAWLKLFYFFVVLILIAVCLIIGPPVLLAIYRKLWLLLLLLLIIPGIKMLRVAIGSIREMAWLNHHLSSYTLGYEGVAYKIWDTMGGTKREGNISYPAMKQAVLTGYVLKDDQLHPIDREYPNPALIIVYEDGFEEASVTIPLEETTAVKTWAETLRTKRIPLYLSTLLVETEDKNQQPRFQRTEVHNPYPMEKPIVVSELIIETELLKNTEPPDSKTDDAAEPGSPDVKTDVADTSDQKQKLPFKAWSSAALKSYAFLIIGSYVLVILTEKEIIADDSFLALLLIFITSCLYFVSLKPYLRWYHMIRFLIEDFIIALVIALIFQHRGGAAEEITSMILGASMLFAAIAWIPFLIVKAKRS